MEQVLGSRPSPLFVGLIFYGGRWYDSATGRFLQQDPIQFAAGDANLYRYCGNDPVNYTDPTGLYIYLGKGQAGRWDPVGVIHQNIAVDKWKEDATPATPHAQNTPLFPAFLAMK